MAANTTPERAALLMIRGAISELPDQDRQLVEDVARQLRAIRAANGDAGTLALSLVAMEVAAEA